MYTLSYLCAYFGIIGVHTYRICSYPEYYTLGEETYYPYTKVK